MGSTWTSTLPVRWSVSTSATPQKLVDLFHARVGSAPGSSTLPPESPTHPAEQYARRPVAALKPKSYVVSGGVKRYFSDKVACSYLAPGPFVKASTVPSSTP